MGFASVVQKRTWPRVAVLGLEGVLAVLISWYAGSLSFLPPSELKLRAGDVFPTYALMDQEGELQSVESSALGVSALYIFYRGDW